MSRVSDPGEVFQLQYSQSMLLQFHEKSRDKSNQPGWMFLNSYAQKLRKTATSSEGNCQGTELLAQKESTSNYNL